jgi:hypothetical protein
LNNLRIPELILNILDSTRRESRYIECATKRSVIDEVTFNSYILASR